MKPYALLFFLVSFLVHAQESVVLYDQEVIENNYNPVYLDVIPSTPQTNIVNIPVEKTISHCLEYETKELFHKDVENCGYDFVEKIICSGGFSELPGVDYYSETQLPSNNRFVRALRNLIGGPNYKPASTSKRPRCQRIEVPEVRECSYFANYCIKKEVKKIVENRKFHLTLKHFPDNAFLKLGIDQNEKLSVELLNMPRNGLNITAFYNNKKVVGAKLKFKSRRHF